MNDDRRWLVEHCNSLNFSGILHLELHILSLHVEGRRSNLGQGIGPDRQHFDVMRFLCGSPFLYFVAFRISDDQLRSRKFLTVGDVLLGDLQLRDVILHLVKLTLEVILNRELDALSRHIAVSRSGLGQDISLSDSQSGYRMRLLLRSPGISRLSSVFLNNRKVCSFDFLLSGQVRLGNLHLLVDQIQLVVCISLIRYCELDWRSKNVSFRCFRLDQRVGLTDNKAADCMSSSIGYPVVDDLSVLIHNLQMGTCDHGDLGIHLADQDLAIDQSNLLIGALLRDREISRLSNRKSFRSTLLDQAVGMPDDQAAYRVSLAIGYPGVDHPANLHGCLAFKSC